MSNEAYSRGRFNWDASVSNIAIQTIAPGAQLDNQPLNSRVAWLQITPTASVAVTGFVAPVAALQNQRLLVTNCAARTSGFNLACLNNTVSTAANRLFTPIAQNAVIYPGHSALFIYDLNTEDGARWRMIDLSLPSTFTLSIAVPAIAVASTLAYLDTSLAGTPLAGAVANTPVVAIPQADLAAAGAGAGYALPGRISSTGNLRIPFVGTLAGGAANFTVGLLGV